MSTWVKQFETKKERENNISVDWVVTSADSYRKDVTLPEAKIVQHMHSA